MRSIKGGISNSVSEALTLQVRLSSESRDGGRTIVDPAVRLFDIRKLLFTLTHILVLNSRPALTDTFVPYVRPGSLIITFLIFEIKFLN